MNRPENPAVKGKYALLYSYLEALEDNQWLASFAEIEAVLGFPLPRSARAHQPWWSNQSNSGSHTHAQAWQRAGWRTRNVSLADETVVFERVSRTTPHLGEDSSETDVAQIDNLGLRDGSVEKAMDQTVSNAPAGSTHTLFEQLARFVMSDVYGVKLRSGKLGRVNKEFDMASPDGTIVGDAKYFSMVGGERLPPAKFSIIAEHVWLLENTGAKEMFLVFGNDRRVPEKWIEKYGELAADVSFYFLSDDGQLEVLKGGVQ